MPTSAPHDIAAIPQQPTDVRGAVIIGAGQMGSGIAQVFAQSGRAVWLVDVAPGSLERAQAGIEASAAKLATRERISDTQLASVRSGITYCDSLDMVQGVDAQIAIEAIVENPDAKIELFRALDELLHPGAILASNTSSISITRLAAATSRPHRVVGMHFMNPVPILELVEVIRGHDTSDQVVRLITDLARDLGKTPVASVDSPGFITNRVLMPMINEAFFCLLESVGSAEDIDNAMRLGMRHPMGPLALADLIGLDTTLSILEVLHTELGEDKYRPCPLLRRYVDAGQLGRKTGTGVYRYDQQ